ncbi:hypothetical protein [Salinicoccus carnicancri]|uniref:hypothetical protein n=1 Tax=Salinicoccus carnicancri TaxID=558170 RepID=UPI0002F91E00|nr:hypothetical protein [Salinicoccus carnicancri]
MQIHWTKINRVIQETPEIRTYMLDCPDGFTWEEGSHTHLGLEGFNAGEKPDKGLVRHMSISTLPDEASIGITTRIRKQRSEFKDMLEGLDAGSPVAIFKTHSNVPLKREGKNVYLLSAGVGLATFRPLVREYMNRPDEVRSLYSLNIDSSKDHLFPGIFESAPKKGFTSKFVDDRDEYYQHVRNLAEDKDGLFYVVGSDAFLIENIALLRGLGIKAEQIMLDKREHMVQEFLG